MLDTHLPYHHDLMRRDYMRCEAMQAAVLNHAGPEKRFLEIGCGSGIFTRLAAKHYKSVVTVEYNWQIKDDLAESFRAFDNIDFLFGDAREVDYGDRQFDVILAELLNTWCMIEDQVSVMNEVLERLLAPGGVVLPRTVVNWCDVGFWDWSLGPKKAQESRYDSKEMVIATASQVTDILQFEPGLKHPDEFEGSVPFTALTDCMMTAVRLGSHTDWCPGVTNSETVTLFLPCFAPIANPRLIKAGESFTLHYRFPHSKPVKEAHFELG